VVAGSTITCPHCGGVGLVRSVESSALRVLRALEEEGEKSKSAAVAVKVPHEIAIYVLNQKRHELARLESEHRMEITFVPQDNLPAGQFEIERLKGRDPGEKPRLHTVGIESGFVRSDEPEPDYVEEVDEDEEEEEIEDTAEAAESEARVPDADGEDAPKGERDGGRDGGRRRRRRGGRGRNRNERDGAREQQPRPEAVTADGEAGEPVEGAGTAPALENGNGQPQQPGEGARRKRRRRGRRGGRDREDRPHDQANPFPTPDRFGAPDEVDTTPTHGGPVLNAPAAPVWSLASDADEVDTTPKLDDSKPKKGWWQKAFGGGDE
jgi:ribonuclease E